MKAAVQMFFAVSVVIAMPAVAQSQAQEIGIKSVELKNGPLSDFYSLLATSSPKTKTSIAQHPNNELKAQDEKQAITLLAETPKLAEQPVKRKQVNN